MVHYEYKYEPSKRFYLPGPELDVIERANREGLKIIDDKGGYYLVAKPASGVILELDDENRILRIVSPKKFIRAYYNRKVVSMKIFEKLVEDLNEGNITFDTIVEFNKKNIIHLS